MQDEPFSRTIHRVLVLNPVLSISSPGFQKSSPGFVKHESGFFSSPGPGFSRVRIFFESESESESGPGFEVCPHVGRCFRLYWQIRLLTYPTCRNPLARINIFGGYYASYILSPYLHLAFCSLTLGLKFI